MSSLFEPINIGEVVQIPNRVVIPPMCQYSSTDGMPSDWHLFHWARLANSKAGLIIIEATGVSPEARITSDCLGLWSDAHRDAIGDLLEQVKRVAPAEFAIQLSHAGRKAASMSPRKGGRGPLKPANAWPTVGPSPIPIREGWPTPVEANRDMLDKVVADFIAAARRAVEIGIRVIELHMAHGYLFSSFMSPIANAREDEYGGSLANRLRFPLEVIHALRAEVPEDIVLGARINGTDWIEDGWSIEEAVIAAREFEKAGINFLDVSSGGNALARIPRFPGYQIPYAAEIRRSVNIPVMGVGLLTDPRAADALVRSETVDLVGVGRGHLYNPHWTWNAANVLEEDLSVPYQYARSFPQ